MGTGSGGQQLQLVYLVPLYHTPPGLLLHLSSPHLAGPRLTLPGLSSTHPALALPGHSSPVPCLPHVVGPSSPCLALVMPGLHSPSRVLALQGLLSPSTSLTGALLSLPGPRLPHLVGSLFSLPSFCLARPPCPSPGPRIARPRHPALILPALLSPGPHLPPLAWSSQCWASPPLTWPSASSPCQAFPPHAQLLPCQASTHPAHALLGLFSPHPALALLDLSLISPCLAGGLLTRPLPSQASCPALSLGWPSPLFIQPC